MNVVKELRAFVKEQARRVTEKPVKLVLGDLPGAVAARCYRNEFVPDDTTIEPFVVDYEIVIGRQYYKEYRHDINELKQGILHEIAHIKCHGHSPAFRKFASEIGVDEIHQRAVWRLD